MKKKDQQQQYHEIQFKVIFLGNYGVGKSAIFQRFNNVCQQQLSTVGIDVMTVKEIKDNSLIKVSIWDTSGQEQFRSIAVQLIRNAKGCILIYDLSNKKSYEDCINYWKSQCDKRSDKSIQFILVGNKLDKLQTTHRQVSFETVTKYTQDNDIPYFEISALSSPDSLIKTLKDTLINQLLKQYNSTPNDFNYFNPHLNASTLQAYTTSSKHISQSSPNKWNTCYSGLICKHNDIQ